MVAKAKVPVVRVRVPAATLEVLVSDALELTVRVVIEPPMLAAVATTFAASVSELLPVTAPRLYEPAPARDVMALHVSDGTLTVPPLHRHRHTDTTTQSQTQAAEEPGKIEIASHLLLIVAVVA